MGVIAIFFSASSWSFRTVENKEQQWTQVVQYYCNKYYNKYVINTVMNTPRNIVVSTVIL